MYRFLIIILVFVTTNLFAQTSYRGFIDKSPIELVTNIYSDGDARAVYVYTNFDEPIIIIGKLDKSTLVLFETDSLKRNKASFTFNNFENKSDNLIGIWKNLKTQKTYHVSLKKKFTLTSGENEVLKNVEIIQPIALKNQYFKLLISKDKSESYPHVTGVKIFEKKTDKLIQKLDINCELQGFNNISVGDYNFDGLQDFSVFESSHAGPNTSSLYFLFNPATKQFFDSGFSGTSLEFDNEKKRISEYNQCCAGSIHTTALYKVVNNKMILIEKHCFKWDEEKQDLVERKMSECE